MKFFFIWVVFSLLSSYLYSQKDSTSKSTIYLGQDRNFTKYVYNRSAVKLGIIDMISGLYGLHFEREWGSIFSTQIGGGLTGRNFTQGLLDEVESDGSNNFVPGGVDIFDSYYNYDNRSPAVGYFIELEPRFYPKEDGFDGTFISFAISYRRYNYTADNIELESTDYHFVKTDPISEYENQIITTIGFGQQSTGSKSIIGYDLNIGIRNISGHRRDLWMIPDQSGNLYATALLNDVKESQFFLSVTLKIGIYWRKK